MPTRQIHFPVPRTKHHSGPPLTPVIFRTWPDGFARGEPIALFPTMPDGPGLVTSYMHVGQHGAADYGLVFSLTRPSTPDEIAPLLAELGQIGHRNLVVYRRWTLAPRRS